MFSSIILHTNAPTSRPAIITPRGSDTWGDLQRMADSFREKLGALARRRLGLALHPISRSYAALAALDKLQADVFLLDPRLSRNELARMASNFQLGAVVDASGGPAESRPLFEELSGEGEWSGEGSITILTSGTGGIPKAVRHTWETLLRPVRKSEDNLALRWLSAYQAHLYAGLQVALQAFANSGTLVIVPPTTGPTEIIKLMNEASVDCVSATPSFWKRLLLCGTEAFKGLALKQITLGGEVAAQLILDQLRIQFPQARIIHIYATTELGRCFAVHDGLEGFPVKYLESSNSDATLMRIEGGELFVKSANGMKGFDPYSANSQSGGSWTATGDLVAIVGDRVLFRGRRSDIINVGGFKVHPLEVERLIHCVPGVRDVRVYGRASAVAGELVACQIVPFDDRNLDDLTEDVHRVCRLQLSEPQRPRIISFVERLEIAPSGKALRTKIA